MPGTSDDLTVPAFQKEATKESRLAGLLRRKGEFQEVRTVPKSWRKALEKASVGGTFPRDGRPTSAAQWILSLEPGWASSPNAPGAAMCFLCREFCCRCTLMARIPAPKHVSVLHDPERPRAAAADAGLVRQRGTGPPQRLFRPLKNG
jgi:hypothetical protein